MRRDLLLAAALLAAAACGEDPSTPRRTFDELRAAIGRADGAATLALMDSESVSYRHAVVREWRAMAARGDDVDTAATGVPLSPQEIESGTEDDVLALLMSRNFQLIKEARWFLDATVVEEAREGPAASRIRLRGKDGGERELWFVLEGGRWRYDHYRTTQLAGG